MLLCCGTAPRKEADSNTMGERRKKEWIYDLPAGGEQAQVYIIHLIIEDSILFDLVSAKSWYVELKTAYLGI